MSELKRPLPEPTKESQPFWDAIQEGKFLVQYCNSCETNIFYPRRACPECWSKDLGWIEAKGTGTIFSTTTTYLGTAPEFNDQLPLNIAWIDLDEGVRIASNIIDCDAEEPKIGDRVQVDIRKVNGEFKLPFFTLIKN